MELGELVFTLNVKTAALMQGVEASIGAMNRLVNTEDKAGASANVLEGRLALLSRQYRMQSSAVENATRAWEQAVAAHGQGSNAANKAESALMKELAALQRLAERMNAANMSAKDLAAAQEQVSESAQEASGQTEAMGAAATAAYAAMAAAAARFMGVLVSAVESGIEAYNRYVASLQGLQSVAAGVGVGTEPLKAAMGGLTDAFFSATSAAASLKNLLSRGYTLDQAVQAISRLKDAAAFGRQASYSLEQAVVSATEGIKNENSILVDNAGVTKNVAKMWEDYARQLGVTVSGLTQKQKVEAEYQGILAETRHQVGDLVKLEGTLAGSQAEARMSAEQLAKAYGEAMSPAVGALTEVWNGFLGIIRDAVEAFPGLSAGVTATALAMTGLMAAGKAALAIQAMNLQLQAATVSATGFAAALYAAMPWLLAIAAVAGVAVAGYTAIKRAQEEAARQAEELKQKREEEMQAARATADDLKGLEERYAELNGKKRLSYSQTKELRAIEERLGSQYGISAGALLGLEGAYESVTEAIRLKRQETLKELQTELDANVAAVEKTQAERRKAADEARTRIAEREAWVAERQAMIAEYQALIDKRPQGKDDGDFVILSDGSEAIITYYHLKNAILDTQREIEGASQVLADALAEDNAVIDQETAAMAATLQARMAAMANSLEAGGTEVSASVRTITDRLFTEMFAAKPDVNMDAVIAAYAQALQNADVAPALKAMDELEARFLSGATLTPAEQQAYERHWQTLVDYTQTVVGQFEVDGDTFARTLFSLSPLINAYGHDAEALSLAIRSLWDAWPDAQVENYAAQGLDTIRADLDNLKTRADNLGDEFADLGQKMTDYNTRLLALSKLLETDYDFTKPFKEQSAAAQAAYTKVSELLGYELTSMDMLTQAQEHNTTLYQSAALEKAAVLDEINLLLTEAANKHLALVSAYGAESREAQALQAVVALLLETMQAASDGSAMDLSLGKSAKETAVDLGALGTQIQATGKAMQELRVKQESIAGIQRLVAEAKKARGAGKDFSEQWEQITKFLGEGFTGSLDDADAAIEAIAAGTKAAADSASASLDEMESQLLSLIAAAERDVTVSPQVKAANLGPLYALLAIINAIRKATGQSAIGGGGGGGGGTSRFQKDIQAMEHEASLGRMTLERELAALEALQRKYRNKRGSSTLSLSDQRDLEQRLYDVREEIRKKEVESALNALEHRKAMGQLNLRQEIAMLSAIRDRYALNAEERLEIEERLYDAREALRQEALQKDMDLYNHKKAMGELSVDQEIAMLRRVLQAHQLTQAERWSLEEQLYALQQQRRDEEQAAVEASLNTQKSAVQRVYRQLVGALKNRLAEEKAAELAALDERIARLQRLTEAENEQARVQDFEEQLAEKQRKLRITKSARERRELEAEIAELMEDEALRQTQAARQAEIEALQNEKDAVNDRYALLTQEENLRQEALRLVMSNNLTQMTELIASYGEEWEDAGASLAEHLTSGLTGAGGILTSLEALAAGMNQAVTAQIAQAASALPLTSARGVQLNIQSLTVREEADIDRVANAIYRRIAAAGR